MTRLINLWIDDSPMKPITLKALHVMPSLLLQKPNKKSKSKDHTKALERRLILWENGELLKLFDEAVAIQERLQPPNPKSDISSISKKFRLFMQKGNINSALRLLTDNMTQGIIPLNDETLLLLEQKHPDQGDLSEDALIDQLSQRIHDIVLDIIDEDMVLKAATYTKGGSGPSGLDADGWRRILCSSTFGTTNTDLRKAIAELTKKLCIESIPESDRSLLEAFVACRLIPLNKNPGLRPIGVDEVLRRIVGKIVINISKNDVIKAAGSLQVCAGQNAGVEAAVNAMHDNFDNDDTEAVLLIDAENAFNSINRKVMLHNISKLCPMIATFINNCYAVPARLFVIGGKEILSREGTTQGDPTSMAAYAIGIIPLLKALFNNTRSNDHTLKEVAYADDFTVAGKLYEIKEFWSKIVDIGPKYGYFPKATKSHLIVKQEYLLSAEQIFADSNILVTSTGQSHLGAVIGSQSYKIEYVNSKVASLVEQLKLLSKIAELEPQSSYCAFVTGFKAKLTFLLRTVPDIKKLLQPIETVVRNEFIPAITGGHLCSENERLLLSLPTRLGGLNLTIFPDDAQVQFNNSRMITKCLVDSIKKQDIDGIYDVGKTKTAKAQVRTLKLDIQKENLALCRNNMTVKQVKVNDINQQKGVSNWLNVLPITEQGFYLNKQEFWDAMRLRYNWSIPNLPSSCVCGARFDVKHSMKCKMGGFVTRRHNDIRDLTSKLLKDVCHDVQLEPNLLPLTGERFDLKSVKTGDDCRPDIRARDFWINGQQAFFDVRVFDPTASRYNNQTLQQSFISNENEKKRNYNRRILSIDNGSFTPLIFSIHGLICLRGSRSLYKKFDVGDDIVVDHEISKLNC
ncbi:uncharacterized protein LOC130636933 [Hydractinia symbiolongicarpus]|uniref:uncharacterized protein LOC130636933 n=1 Tax=Hydractinia symbiolongicarpus TaxID=13093 RepID=UPI00254C825E|nr:uncharacterized protein LOC130636933 [Hydractinia symbiolongicarpus]